MQHTTEAVSASGARGMVTSPHQLASAEGRRVLAQGGNAIEATIAMGAVLSVVYPHFCGLGGDAVWMVADGEGRKRCFLGIGQAARDCAGYAAGVPARGGRSAATTACLVDSWDHALAFSRDHWSGTRPLATLLDRAIELAQEGFPVSASQRFWLDFRRDEWRGWPGFAALFDTRALGEGRFVQTALAASLREIADYGPRSFYEGALGRRIAEGLAQAGSPLVMADLTATKTRECAPLALDYAGHTLLAPPPPTQGVTTLMIMGILERLGIARVGKATPDFYHLLVEAVKQAFLVRQGIADPDFSAQPVALWLTSLTLEELAAKVRPGSALPWGEQFRTGDTVYLAATDSAGRSTSVLQSIYFDWGSGVVAGDTGILWQNRAAAFSTHGNALRPGARPFYTLNPGIALRHGRPRILYGTQGADGQPQTLATLLARVIDHGMDPAEALAAPRFLLGKTFSGGDENLRLEADAGERVFAALRRRGHDVVALPAASPISGQAGLIVIDDGIARGAHDPRSDGIAMAVE